MQSITELFNNNEKNLLNEYLKHYKINEIDNNGKTLLHYACIYKLYNLANYLINIYDDDIINKQDNDGYTSLIHILNINLDENKINYDEIKNISNKLILKMNFLSLDYETKDGKTALLEACKNGFEDIALSLLNLDVNLILYVKDFKDEIYWCEYHEMINLKMKILSKISLNEISDYIEFNRKI